MKLKMAFVIMLLSLLLATVAGAATFTVDIAADDADAHDTNPGDGVCSDSFGSCTLRAALEEANATAALDVILFANGFVDAVLVIAASEGPLPIITNQVFILADSIDAYNSSATLLRDAPPQFTIDGSQLTSSGEHGLLFSGAGASDSAVTALSIVSFPGTGILAAPGADRLVIDRNYIGVRPDRSAAGNGGHGFHAADTDQHLIGKDRNAGGTAFTGLGNVISSNGQSGVRLESSDSNEVRANLIGFSPSGSGDRGNDQYGIHISGSNNQIGDSVSSDSAGNFIGANDLGSILITGNSNFVYSNELGRGETGGFITSEGDGIRVFGSLNFIGNNDNGNEIYEHDGAAIRLGETGGSVADDNFVIDNQIGSAGSQFPLLLSGNFRGIDVGNGDRNVIVDNVVINSTSLGINVMGNDNNLQGNQVGFIDGLFGPIGEPNSVGLMMVGGGNIVGSAANPNYFGGNTREGVRLSANNTLFEFNRIGVDDAFEPIGNGMQGIISFGINATIRDNIIGANGLDGVEMHIAGGSNINNNFIGIAPNDSNIGNGGDGISIVESTQDIDVVFNQIAFNGQNGIFVSNIANLNGLTWFQNLMHDNGGIGVDLRGDGVTPNDPGDFDESGPNRLQNYPVITSTELDTLVSPSTLTIGYRVDTDMGSADYPLTIDFYWSDVDENAQGRFYLGAEFGYNTPNAIQMITFDMADNVINGWVTATARDSSGNSSEMAERMMFGELGEEFFVDGFED